MLREICVFLSRQKVMPNMLLLLKRRMAKIAMSSRGIRVAMSIWMSSKCSSLVCTHPNNTILTPISHGQTLRARRFATSIADKLKRSIVQLLARIFVSSSVIKSTLCTGATLCGTSLVVKMIFSLRANSTKETGFLVFLSSITSCSVINPNCQPNSVRIRGITSITCFLFY